METAILAAIEAALMTVCALWVLGRDEVLGQGEALRNVSRACPTR